MQAISNKVVIGELSSPMFVFYNENIKKVYEESATSAIGDELFIDQFVPEVRYGLVIRYQICPADIADYERILTSEGLVWCAFYNDDIRAIPYGTPVHFYSDDKLVGLYYCEDVKRIGKELFKITCVSEVGLMDRQNHQGGIYTGQRFDAVLREIVGDEYTYEIEPGVAEQQVYGWLPYASKRSNLHQLLLAYGVTRARTDLGGVVYQFLKTLDSAEIPRDRIFLGGEITYGDAASRVEVIEHGYYYLSSVELVTLFDTKGETVDHSLVTFSEPVYAESLTVEEGGSLTIHEYGVNHAVISGAGVLLGQRYIHTTRRLVAENEEADTEKNVKVEEATLITMANSENCLKRISEYYFNATIVKNSIILKEEKTGRRYAFDNDYLEYTNAFLSHMSVTSSSFLRAECEFIQDYVPIAQGSSFQRRDILTLSEEEQIWTVPDSVYDKDVPQVRVVLIGAGYDGESGSDGEAGKPIFDDKGGDGGAGGKGGKGGKGGRILSVTIDCSNLAFLRYGRTGKNTWLYAGDDYYTSAAGASSSSGFVEMFTGAVYALPGSDGIDGAPGGKGGTYPPIAQFGVATSGENGGDVELEGVTYKGGKPAARIMATGSQLGITSYMEVYHGGCGGGGAAAGAKGEDARKGWQLVNGSSVWGKGGDGADALAAKPTVALYGSGGGGGGGGGGAATQHWWNSVYTTLIALYSLGTGAGGKGSEGTAGYEGCIIIYY